MSHEALRKHLVHLFSRILSKIHQMEPFNWKIFFRSLHQLDIAVFTILSVVRWAKLNIFGPIIAEISLFYVIYSSTGLLF